MTGRIGTQTGCIPEIGMGRGRRSWSRRALLSGLLAGMPATLGVLAWRAAPRFWRIWLTDWNRPVFPAPRRPRPEQWPDHGLHIAWLGHATVLIKIDGFTILTDPALETRVGLDFGPWKLGIKRLVEPALDWSELPRIDLLLLSHAHMDHWDIPSLRHLERHRPPVVTAWETSDLLRPNHYRTVRELRWGDVCHVGPVRIRAFEVNHWGARWRTDTYRGYNGYLIESERFRLLFAGDTAWTPAFRQLRSSQPIQVAIMPVGAYNPWIRYHCTPEQAVRMANDAGAEWIVPVHHRTFRLSDEPVHEPLERTLNAVQPHPERVVIREIGEEFHLVA